LGQSLVQSEALPGQFLNREPRCRHTELQSFAEQSITGLEREQGVFGLNNTGIDELGRGLWVERDIHADGTREPSTPEDFFLAQPQGLRIGELATARRPPPEPELPPNRGGPDR